jgi:hypothetical protein
MKESRCFAPGDRVTLTTIGAGQSATVIAADLLVAEVEVDRRPGQLTPYWSWELAPVDPTTDPGPSVWSPRPVLPRSKGRPRRARSRRRR